MLNVDQMSFAVVIHHAFEDTPYVVALVEIDTYTYNADSLLDQVWELTNTKHKDKPWWENQQVIKIFTKKGCRSTSVGDIIKIDDDYWKVAPVGFDKLNGVPEEWHVARAKLNVVD
jgi:hypothetical protein